MQKETGCGLLPLKNDLLFQKIFSDQDNNDILKSFLSSSLELPGEEFDDPVIADPRMERDFPGDKLVVLDVRVKTKYGIFIDVEVQLCRMAYMPERIMFYNAKNLASQLKEGDRYGKVGKSITIMIANYNVFPKESTYRHSFRMYDTRTGTTFTDSVAVHVFELKKLAHASAENEWEEILLDWLRLIKSEDLEEIEMLAAKSPEMEKTVRIIKRFSADERARMEIEDREKALRDQISLVEDTREVAKAEGKLEGKLETAKNMLAKGFAADVVCDVTELSIEEITALRGE